MKKIIALALITVGWVLATSFSTVVKEELSLKVSERKLSTCKLKARNLKDMFEISSGGYWGLSEKNETLYASLYDSKLNFIKGRYIYFEYARKDLELVDIISVDGEYVIFLGFTNQKQKKSYIFYTRFDPQELKTDDQLYKVGEVRSPKGSSRLQGFYVRQDPEKKKILVAGVHPGIIQTSDNPGAIKMNFWVLDNEMKITNYIEDHELLLDEGGTRFSFRDFAIEGNGTIYVLGRNMEVQKPGKKETEEKIKYSAFVLEEIDSDGETSQYVTEVEDFMKDMRLLVGEADKLDLVGLLGEEKYGKVVTTGVVRITLKKNGLDEVNYIQAPLTEEVLYVVNNTKYLEDRLSKKKKITKEDKMEQELLESGAVDMHTIIDAQLDHQGNPVMFLEERYVREVTTTTTTSSGSTSSRTTYYYHYDDALLITFDEQDAYQSPVAKWYFSVNQEIVNPTLLLTSTDMVTLAMPDRVHRYSEKLRKAVSKGFVGIKNEPKSPKPVHIDHFIFKKELSDGRLLAVNQVIKKTTWYFVTIE